MIKRGHRAVPVIYSRGAVTGPERRLVEINAPGLHDMPRWVLPAAPPHRK